MTFIDDYKDLRDLIEMPEGFKPGYGNLLEAVRASCLWAIAEQRTLGSFHDRMDLCSYAEWCCDKALGRPHAEEWEGVPRLILERKS